MRAAIDVDRLAGDEPAILADQEPAYNSLRFRTVGWQIPSQEGRGGKMNSDDDPEVLQTVLRAAALEETESYLVRGRRFERLSKEDLSKRWIAGFKAWCRNHTLELQREFDDTAAELMLRGEEPPFDAVRDETAALADEAARDVSTQGGADRARLSARIRELLTQGRGRPTQ
jgi:hypothetical protein